MRLRLWLYVLCWQYTAADTSWESTAATYGPRSNRARGRCRCGVGGPSRRGTASYRASSSSPCPAPTRSPGKGCILRFSVQNQRVFFIFYLTLFVDFAVKWVRTPILLHFWTSCKLIYHIPLVWWVQTENQLSNSAVQLSFVEIMSF